jgi:hypothetical protein
MCNVCQQKLAISYIIMNTITTITVTTFTRFVDKTALTYWCFETMDDVHMRKKVNKK